MKPFIDLGTRNKGTYWEFVSGYSFLHTKLPVSNFSLPTFFGIGKDEPNKHCHHEAIIEAGKQCIIKEFEKGFYTPSFFQRLDAVYTEPLKEIEELCKQDFLQDDTACLIQKFNIITKALAESHKPMLLALYAQFIDNFFQQTLQETTGKKDDQTLQEYTALLLTSIKLTQAQKEEEQLMHIQQLFAAKQFDDAFTQQLLQQLVDTCGWFHMEYMQEPWGTTEYVNLVIERIQTNLVVKLPSENIRQAKKAQEVFFKKYPHAKKLKELSYVLREFSMILDASKAMIVRGSYLARPLFTHIAEKIGLSWRDMLYLVPPEIVALLQENKKASPSLIKKRKQCRAVLLQKKGITVFTGEEAKKKGQELVQRDAAKSNEHVSGIIAYQGIVRGKVTRIDSVFDKDKFTPGDILVTHDGTAELTYFLKHAAAIVTDQGGMICHAAIVAREMKTPCIVGTKIATKVFKDGDQVEVDAHTGVVKKL